MTEIIEERPGQINSLPTGEYYRDASCVDSNVLNQHIRECILHDLDYEPATPARRGNSLRGVVASLRGALIRLGLEPRAILLGTQASSAPVVERDEREHPNHRQDDKDLQQDVTHDECLSIVVIRRRTNSTPGAYIDERDKSAATLPHRRTICNVNRPNHALKPGGIPEATAATFGIPISLQRRTAPSAGATAANI